MKTFVSLLILTGVSAFTVVPTPRFSTTLEAAAPSGTLGERLSRSQERTHSVDPDNARRNLMVGSLFWLASAGAANALDMDAFVNSQLEADTKNCDPKKDPKCIPKLTADEA